MMYTYTCEDLTLSTFQVDLAGSECVGRSGAVDKRAREAGDYLFFCCFII